eukprot:1157653-Pelagomonas_calceolata.AAC.11
MPAGHQIVEALKRDASILPKDQVPLCIGLPRGGVPVAWQVAKELDAPLDVLIVRKLGMTVEQICCSAVCHSLLGGPFKHDLIIEFRLLECLQSKT